jgi:AbrB family looped-hinge helix DNA binding protein
MKKYPKIVQADKRGQIVIPKDIRNELKIDEGTGFWMYSVTDEGILLKKIDTPIIDENESNISTLDEKSEKLDINPENLKKTLNRYKKTKEGNLELI